MKALGIYRAKRYSPAKSESDREILDVTLNILQQNGWEISAITEETLTNYRIRPERFTKDPRYLPDTCPIAVRYLKETDIVLSMARSEEALKLLKGVKCVNSTDGITGCTERRYLDGDIDDGNDNRKGVSLPCWIKRADGCAEEKADVSRCASKEELDNNIKLFKARQIKRWIIQPHYEGDLVKFYGIAGQKFLQTSYPTETGQTKFGLERNNSPCRHYYFNKADMKSIADGIADKLGVPVYGGDAIIDENGGIHLIDFNDWPTFAPCRAEAAQCIADLVDSLCSGRVSPGA